MGVLNSDPVWEEQCQVRGEGKVPDILLKFPLRFQGFVGLSEKREWRKIGYDFEWRRRCM